MKISKAAIEACRKSCLCSAESMPDDYPVYKYDSTWQCCAEYWSNPSLQDWCSGCYNAIALISLDEFVKRIKV